MNNPIPQEAFPLTWPMSWPRHVGARHKSKFIRNNSYSNRKRSMHEACQFLLSEIRRLKGSRVLISTNTAIKPDGTPYAGRATPSDTGAAIYFSLKGKDIVFACDRWDRVEDNIYAVGKHIEAIRAQERWGVGTVDQAFSAYMALPAPIIAGQAKPWYEVMGCRAHCPTNMVQALYKREAMNRHPDRGGSEESMSELNEAYARFKTERGL